MTKVKFITLILFSIFVASPALFAEQGEIKVPPMSGPVVDEVKLLKPLEGEQLERMLMKMYETGKIQMAVYITKSLQGYDIESFSISVAEKWKLGSKGQDQGLLFVVAPTERRMRLEVGYGLEGDITDAFSKQVLDDHVVPYFRKQRFGEGLMVATEAISKKLGLDLNAPVKNRIQRSAGKQRSFFSLLFPFIFLIFWLFLFLRGFFLPYGAGRGWGYHSSGGGSFGGFGGGGFSGGGGSFGGGGASSSW